MGSIPRNIDRAWLLTFTRRESHAGRRLCWMMIARAEAGTKATPGRRGEARRTGCRVQALAAYPPPRSRAVLRPPALALSTSGMVHSNPGIVHNPSA